MKAKLGSGARFRKLKNELIKAGNSSDSAERIAAYVGRKKYGNKRFQKLAAKGRKK